MKLCTTPVSLNIQTGKVSEYGWNSQHAMLLGGAGSWPQHLGAI